MRNDKTIITSMIEYYRARATEYDQWFFREGRYDRGETFRESWFSEIAKVEKALGEAKPYGEILELACGTGIWTQKLVETAAVVTAVDASPEVIAVNRSRVHSAQVEYIVGNLFEWKPSKKFDFVFFGFWLSHVPRERFDSFWHSVRSALKPGGRVFFVDSLFNQETTAKDHKEITKTGVVERKLNDGRTFEIVKIFYEPGQLEEKLHSLGWNGPVYSTGTFFLHGCVTFLS